MTWRVPFVDFPEQFRRQEAELLAIIREVLSRGDLIMRRHLVNFEEHLAAFCGVDHAVGVSNCTDALRLVAHALGIGSGDEVVTVSHTFVATMSPFKLLGAEPVLVDIGSDHLMDPGLLKGVVTERTRAIVPVHLNGRVCDMNRIMPLADSVGAVVIEDAAQALGATYRGCRAGSLGKASVFSFYPAKLLGAVGDAGAVVTNDAALAADVRSLRDHGRITKSELGGWGYNCRLDNLQAAILDFRLRLLPLCIERRRELAGLYHEAFRTADQVRTLPGPSQSDARFDVFQNYPISVRNRDGLASALSEAGIETMISWPIPLHHQKPLGLDHFELPLTERLSQEVLSLPLFPELEDWQVNFVASAVLDFVGREA